MAGKMETDNTKSSTSGPQMSNSDGEEMKHSMRLLRRVLEKCKEDEEQATRRKCEKKYIPFSDYIKRAARYTGLHEKFLRTIEEITRGKRLNRSLDNILDHNTVYRNFIHNRLVKCYLERQIVPTTRQLFEDSCDIIPGFIDIRQFRRILVKFGYVWKKLPHRQVIIERPTVTFDRYHYLKKKMQFREDEWPVFHLDVGYCTKDGFHMMSSINDVEKDECCYITVVSESRMVYEIQKNFTEESYLKWIEDELVCQLAPNSVLVLNDVDYNSRELVKLPNEDSLKTDMITWLDHHEVPCSRSMSKAELFSLVETRTDATEKMYRIDKILKAYGHTVLRLPQSIEHLTPVRFIRKLIMNNVFMKSDDDLENERSTREGNTFAYAMSIEAIYEDITPSHLSTYFGYIYKEEDEIFKMDVAVDVNLDGLLKRMTELPPRDDGADEDSEGPTNYDSE